jgi:Alcohol dehydrogenase GroES-like domain
VAGAEIPGRAPFLVLQVTCLVRGMLSARMPSLQNGLPPTVIPMATRCNAPGSPASPCMRRNLILKPGRRPAIKAVVYHGPRQVSVDEVPDARIEKPTDVLVQITATNICGSDLHMYEGRTDFAEGRIFGHENVGEVIEVGDAVEKVQVGDMILAPFNVACGNWSACRRPARQPPPRRRRSRPRCPAPRRAAARRRPW